MKNITVSVDDETYRRTRIKAAEAGTSVSALVRAYLVSLAQGDAAGSGFERLRRLQEDTLQAIAARGAGLDPEENLARDRVHDRDALR